MHIRNALDNLKELLTDELLEWARFTLWPFQHRFASLLMSTAKSSQYEHRATHYRDKAADCRRQAKLAMDAKGLLFIAQHYEDLATEMDRLAAIHSKG